ncbi:recombinase family protein [Kineococcus aurantiacus]|uniref:DNA invertase Pin-like site-specific DNA recombinase n=1 Tax=Kineococcus aurantiacus TaxID=37633 RepID=A0A7Y9DIV3_9ACTN|nr:recombinase family protein [Kineococcus aurantiacus]NYD20939.1 DNA invertase Pin-like site-specific DNA recombinase [Kineococcus aurantiacus]
MVERAAVYCRISQDTQGLALGVTRQRDACVDLAGRNDWAVDHVLVDNDVSAYLGRERPAYQELLRLIAADSIDIVVAWAPDRLHRSPAELETFIDLLERHRVNVVTVQAGRWDLSTASGRMTARVLGSVARHESELKGERVAAAAAQRAQQGRRSSWLPYGWRREVDAVTGVTHEVLHEEQAAVIVRIADELLAGRSMNSIARGLTTDDVATPSGVPWKPQLVRRLVKRQSNAARREHNGIVVGEAAWPAILPGEKLDRVLALLNDPARRTAASTRAVHLLAGLARCGICSETMRCGRTARSSARIYRCSGRGCTQRDADRLDELVVGAALTRLRQPDARKLLVASRNGDAAAARAQLEADELQARLDLAADQYADGLLDARSHLRIVERLRPKMAAARAAARAALPTPGLADLVDAVDVHAAWDRLDLAQRRAVINALLTITVHRPPRTGRTFHRESIDLRFGHDQG